MARLQISLERVWGPLKQGFFDFILHVNLLVLLWFQDLHSKGIAADDDDTMGRFGVF